VLRPHIKDHRFCLADRRFYRGHMEVFVKPSGITGISLYPSTG